MENEPGVCPQDGREDVLRPRVFPIWSLLEYRRTLRLEGFQVLTAPLIFSLTLLDIDQLATPQRAPPGSAGSVTRSGVVEVRLHSVMSHSATAEGSRTFCAHVIQRHTYAPQHTTILRSPETLGW